MQTEHVLTIYHLVHVDLSGKVYMYFVSFVLQVHLIDFDDESNIINKNVFLHSVGEIW